MEKKQINEQLMNAIFRINRMMKRGMSKSSKVAQLTFIQIEILMCLKQHKKIKGSEVAHYFDVSKSTSSIHLDKLEQLKLIFREADKNDRRIDWLALTVKGNKLLDEGLKDRNIRVSKLLNYIAQKDKQKLLTIITRLLEKLEESI